MKKFYNLIKSVENIPFKQIIIGKEPLKYLRGSVAINQDTYNKLNNVAFNFFKENSFISLKEYFNMIFDYWVEFWTKSKNFENTKTAFDQLYNSIPKNFYAIRSVQGIVDDNLETINISDIALMNKNDLESYFKSNNIDVNSLGSLFSSHVKALENNVIVLKVKAITRNRARDISDEKFKIIENFLNYFNDDKIAPIFIITPFFTEHSNNSMIIESTTVDKHKTSIHYKPNSTPYSTMNISQLLVEKEKLFYFIFSLLSIHDKTNITKSLFVAINWIGKANIEKDDTIAFTEYMFALECLLYNASKSDIITPSILFQITNKATFLLINEREENYIEKRKNYLVN